MPCELAAAGSPQWVLRQRGVLPGPAGYPKPGLELLALELRLAAPYARSMRLLEREPFDDPGALFGVLTEDPRVHWSRSELEIQMGWDAVRVEDTLAELDARWPSTPSWPLCMGNDRRRALPRAHGLSGRRRLAMI